MILKQLARLPEFGRYFLISALALAADVCVLLLAAQVLHYLLAATLGFVVGSLISFILAVRWVFPMRRLAAEPRTELFVYALVGLTGLGLNNAIIALSVEGLGVPLIAAKTGAAGASFVFNFGVRKWMLFRA